MLTERFPPDSLTIVPHSAWHPRPRISDRAEWERLPVPVRQVYAAHAEAVAAASWPQLPARLALEYARDGNRSRFEAPYFQRRSMLVALCVAECMEDRGRFLDSIADGIWAIAEESSWCIPAHVGVQRAGPGLPDPEEPIVDLFAAQTAAELSFARYLLHDRLDRVSPLLGRRIRLEVERRVLGPSLARDDFWWMGLAGPPRRLNNWTPWIVSNILASGLLVEESDERRRRIVSRGMLCLDRFLDPYPRDGGCDEGPGYWSRAGASVFDCLDTLWSATGGSIDLWADPLIREIGRYIARVQVGGEYFVNFADASALASPPAAEVYSFGRRIGDADLARLGASLALRQDLACRGSTRPRAASAGGLERLLRELFLLDELASAQAAEPLPRDSWLEEIQLMTARDRSGSRDGLFVAAKGGHNAESHNHNDIGSFVVYADGKPVIVDAGVGQYTRETFSDQRYTIWTMQSAFHSLLPTIDGVMQAPGREHAAREVSWNATDATATFELDLAGAYPAEAGIMRWRRRISLERGRALVVEDEWELGRGARELELSFLTACRVRVGSSGQIELDEAALPEGRTSGTATAIVSVRGAAGPPAIRIEGIRLDDPRLRSVWGTSLARVVLCIASPPRRGGLTLGVTGRQAAR